MARMAFYDRFRFGNGVQNALVGPSSFYRNGELPDKAVQIRSLKEAVKSLSYCVALIIVDSVRTLTNGKYYHKTGCAIGQPSLDEGSICLRFNHCLMHELVIRHFGIRCEEGAFKVVKIYS